MICIMDVGGGANLELIDESVTVRHGLALSFAPAGVINRPSNNDELSFQREPISRIDFMNCSSF